MRPLRSFAAPHCYSGRTYPRNEVTTEQAAQHVVSSVARADRHKIVLRYPVENLAHQSYSGLPSPASGIFTKTGDEGLPVDLRCVEKALVGKAIADRKEGGGPQTDEDAEALGMRFVAALFGIPNCDARSDRCHAEHVHEVLGQARFLEQLDHVSWFSTQLLAASCQETRTIPGRCNASTFKDQSAEIDG
jgi:hypothetical protein